MAEEMKKSISSGAKSGRKYGNHTTSAPGQSPANWTGKLLRSIKIQKTKGMAFVYITAKYAEFLEFGTSKMRARPFIIPAFIKTKKYIQDRLKRIAK
jgi:HK97 gp10 family phage protein